jgi:hypothetical protein
MADMIAGGGMIVISNFAGRMGLSRFGKGGNCSCELHETSSIGGMGAVTLCCLDTGNVASKLANKSIKSLGKNREQVGFFDVVEWADFKGACATHPYGVQGRALGLRSPRLSIPKYARIKNILNYSFQYQHLK